MLVGLISFFTFFILLGNMIPISLTVTLESFIKFSSGYWIQWDGHMYYKELNKGALCRNPNIIEETGQIQIVLSDKTGTLTQNKMHFLKGAIHGIGYGKGVTEVQLAQAKLDGTEKKILKNAVSDEEVCALFGPQMSPCLTVSNCVCIRFCCCVSAPKRSRISGKTKDSCFTMSVSAETLGVKRETNQQPRVWKITCAHLLCAIQCSRVRTSWTAARSITALRAPTMVRWWWLLRIWDSSS